MCVCVHVCVRVCVCVRVEPSSGLHYETRLLKHRNVACLFELKMYLQRFSFILAEKCDITLIKFVIDETEDQGDTMQYKKCSM